MHPANENIIDTKLNMQLKVSYQLLGEWRSEIIRLFKLNLICNRDMFSGYMFASGRLSESHESDKSIVG